MGGLTGKQIQSLEQLGPMMRDHFCPIVGNIFKGYLENGFDRQEALHRPELLEAQGARSALLRNIPEAL